MHRLTKPITRADNFPSFTTFPPRLDRYVAVMIELPARIAQSSKSKEGGSMHPIRSGFGQCVFLATTLLCTLTVVAAPSPRPVYKDPSALLDQRVEDLLARMTLEEKIAQITCVWNGKREILTVKGEFDPVKTKSLFRDGIGQIARPSDLRG